ncbi:uncharacterized protein LOC111117287 isoform X2 [Crassostrea virginica]|uniref:Uncharacterized protein LOC111117287 n=1 Tax=Crassostrea virginica TaxID=6565 RepID=A0A8B8CBJ0_CRAVI|nr:uncharacterized protein LOC111117287 [Crassostrea virginica]
MKSVRGRSTRPVRNKGDISLHQYKDLEIQGENWEDEVNEMIITPPDFEPASTEPPSKISSKISHVQTTKMPTTKLATRKIPDVQTTKMLTTKLATRKIPDVQTTKMLTTKLATRKIPDVQSTPDIPKIKDDTTASTQTGNDDDDSSVETLMAVLLNMGKA